MGDAVIIEEKMQDGLSEDLGKAANERMYSAGLRTKIKDNMKSPYGR